MAARGHAVTVLAISADLRTGFHRETEAGVEIVHTPDLFSGRARSGWDPWDTLQRIRFLRGKSWEIVHAWDCRPAVILPALYAHRQSRAAGGRLVIDWCDWFGRGGTQAERPDGMAKLLYGPIETYFEEAFRHRADGSTVISQALFDRAVGLGVAEDTIRLLPQGCDPPLDTVGRSAARKRLGISSTAPLVITVGRMTGSEAALLIETLGLLFDKRPDVSVAMIGRHGATLPPDLVNRRQLTAVGFVDDETLGDYVAAADAMLVPLTDSVASRARWPSKVNPLLSAGRAVVMSRVGDLAGLLEREGAAMIVEPTAAALAGAVEAILDDPQTREAIEASARRVAGEMLLWSRLGKELNDFYGELKRNQ